VNDQSKDAAIGNAIETAIIVTVVVENGAPEIEEAAQAKGIENVAPDVVPVREVRRIEIAAEIEEIVIEAEIDRRTCRMIDEAAIGIHSVVIEAIETGIEIEIAATENDPVSKVVVVRRETKGKEIVDIRTEKRNENPKRNKISNQAMGIIEKSRRIFIMNFCIFFAVNFDGMACMLLSNDLLVC